MTIRYTRQQAAIVRDGCLLLLQCRLPGEPPFWVLPGGGRETGESDAEAVAREVREELGVDVEVGDMIMPMAGFVFMLIVVGGLASLVAAADGRHARLAVYLGPVCLFAGLAALLLSVGLGVFCEQALGRRELSGPGFFGGYGAGVIGGAALGFRRAAYIRRRIESGGAGR